MIPIRWAALLLLVGVGAAMTAYAAACPRGFSWSARQRRIATILAGSALLVAVAPAALELFAQAPAPGPQPGVSVEPHPAALSTRLVLAAAVALVIVSFVLAVRLPLGDFAAPAILVEIACGLCVRQAALAAQLSLAGLLVMLLGGVIGGGLAGFVLLSVARLFVHRPGAPRQRSRRRGHLR